MEGRKVVLLSGPIAAGKSTIADLLIRQHGYVSIRSGAYLRGLAITLGLDASRRGLQDLGDRKDEETDYAWLIDDVAVPLIEARADTRTWLLDCVRKPRQIDHFRVRFPQQVVHVHVTAPEQELRRRYDERLAQGAEYLGATAYETAITHPNEQQARALVSLADIVIDTHTGAGLERLLA